MELFLHACDYYRLVLRQTRRKHRIFRIKIVQQDGGIISVHFEFTEWIHTINPEDYDDESLNKWIIANSSHVIDTVFYLIGNPKIINSKILKT